MTISYQPTQPKPSAFRVPGCQDWMRPGHDLGLHSRLSSGLPSTHTPSTLGAPVEGGVPKGIRVLLESLGHHLDLPGVGRVVVFGAFKRGGGCFLCSAIAFQEVVSFCSSGSPWWNHAVLSHGKSTKPWCQEIHWTMLRWRQRTGDTGGLDSLDSLSLP